MSANRIVLGPWRLITEENQSCWRPPEGATAALDLRRRDEYRLEGPPGLGLFVMPPEITLPAEYDVLSLDHPSDTHSTVWLQDALPARAGFRAEGDRLTDILFDLLTRGADLAGDEAPAPIMPDSQNRLQLFLGTCLKNERFRFGRHPHHERVVRSHARHVTRILQESEQVDNPTPAGQHLRFLDALVDKYRVRRQPWREALPTDLRNQIADIAPTDEDLIPHETSLFDAFDRPDQTELGTAAEGWAWDTSNGRMEIGSQFARGRDWSAGIVFLRAGKALSIDDQSAEVWVDGVVDAYGRGGGACRIDVAAGDAYGTLLRANTTTASEVMIGKWVGGAYTSLYQQLENLPAAARRVRCVVDGSTVSMWLDGQLWRQITDTTVAGNLFTGLAIRSVPSAMPRLNDFAAADLFGVPVELNMPRGVDRGIERGVH